MNFTLGCIFCSHRVLTRTLPDSLTFDEIEFRVKNAACVMQSDYTQPKVCLPKIASALDVDSKLPFKVIL